MRIETQGNKSKFLKTHSIFIQSVLRGFRMIHSKVSRDTHTHTHTYICKKLTCYIKNIRDITMDNKLTTVPDGKPILKKLSV